MTTNQAQLNELLAYELFSHCSPNGQAVPSEERWRTDRDLRLTWRTTAGKLVENLESRGIKVQAAKPNQVEREARQLTIIPARAAYTLDEEVPCE